MNAPATFCQFITPAGAGAIAVIRLTGERAWELVCRFIDRAEGSLPDRPDPGRLYYGHFTIDGATLDDVIVAGWTDAGGDVADISCHGGLRVTERICGAFISAGAVHHTPVAAATWQEGFDRAMDACIARAQTRPAVRFLLAQRPMLHAEFSRIIAMAEGGSLDAARFKLTELITRAPGGIYYAQPARVALVGSPNVGKSMLANRLAGRERAVVADVAGTTRDWVVLRAAWQGVPVHLVDTAGLHAAGGELESEAMRRGADQVRSADLQLLVLDSAAPPDDLTRWSRFVTADRLIVVWNKQDRVDEGRVDPDSLPWPAPSVASSALTGAGLDELRSVALARMGIPSIDVDQAVLVEPSLRIRLRSLAESVAGRSAAQWSADLQAALCEPISSQAGIGGIGGV